MHEISIHALLAESDADVVSVQHGRQNFYPRSPCGERRPVKVCSAHGPVFLSTLSLRRATSRGSVSMPRYRFLSTLSLRRATHYGWSWYDDFTISIHALLAESDLLSCSVKTMSALFLSTLSLRRATAALLPTDGLFFLFLSTLSLRRATFPL